MIDERLVLATALVHATPGALLAVIDEDQRTVTIGHHPSAQIDPCRWRRAVVAARRNRSGGGLGEVRFDALGGSLAARPGGVFVERATPCARTFVTTLCPRSVAELLVDAPLGSLDPESVIATIRPDAELGVTLVGVAVDDERGVDELERVTGAIAATALVHELTASLPIVRH